MKKMKLVSLILASALVVGCLAGCGTKEGNGSEGGKSAKDIEISYWHSGLDIEWLDAIVKGFNEKYPEYNAYYNATASDAAAAAAFGMEDTDTVDLYFVNKKYDTTYLEPLNEVLDTTVEGESKSIKEKFSQAYLAAEEKDGKYYTLTYGGGLIGFVYSKSLFEQVGITQLPRTTDELALVCGTLSDNGIKPLCHYKTSGQYRMLNEVWFAQYEGIENYYDFYNNPSKDRMTKNDGRYEVLKVHEKINTSENVLQGSNSDSHISMQTKFLEGKCAMMATGSWLSSEMSNSDKIDNFAMMKMPVISSITDKLSTVKSEPELRKLITAIDNVTDGTESEDTYKDGKNYKVEGKSVSAADWEYVKAARNSLSSSYASQSCYIPNYSNAKEGAKEFLKYLYSDEGYKLYLDTLHIQMPLSLSEGEIDTTSWNAFEQNQAQLFESSEYLVASAIMNKHRLFTDGGAHSFADYEFVNLMCSNNEADRISADDAWNAIVAKINDKYDNDWMLNIK